MKLLSYQPFSLYETGGGSRILRRLYEGHEAQVTSLFVKFFEGKPVRGSIEEKHVTIFPLVKPWMRWHVRSWAMNLQVNAFKAFTEKAICSAARKLHYDVIHVVNHGAFSTTLCDDVARSGKVLWASFHDHFSINGSCFAEAERLWNQASRRLVISETMGEEYASLFGQKKYELITDGVLPHELSTPAAANNDSTIFYFAGLLHHDYLPLFSTLADALNILAKQGKNVRLVLRGTQRVDFLENRSFTVEYRPVTLNQAELKKELDAATVLYLPIKLTNPDFYLYSLSTKMVGYLAAPGAILYHGPKDSAAGELLQQAEAAVCSETLDAQELVDSIKELLERGGKAYSENAKELVREKFDLLQIRHTFWQLTPTRHDENIPV